jgi:predicted transcriptional regulator with HTH domain
LIPRQQQLSEMTRVVGSDDSEVAMNESRLAMNALLWQGMRCSGVRVDQGWIKGVRR